MRKKTERREGGREREGSAKEIHKQVQQTKKKKTKNPKNPKKSVFILSCMKILGDQLSLENKAADSTISPLSVMQG